jgi:hypothetical protein
MPYDNNLEPSRPKIEEPIEPVINLRRSENSEISPLPPQDEDQEEDLAIAEIAEAEEIDLANQLDREYQLSLILQQADQIKQEGQSFGRPSFFKYFVILIPWAIVVDLVDAADLTGIGIILGRAFSIFSWVSIMLIMWFTDGELKRAHRYTENLEETVADIQKNIAQTTRFALRGSKILRRVPGMKGVARQIPRTLVKIRRAARKNPLTKVLIGGAINMFPFLAIFNLLFVWVYLSYRDEKKSFKHAQEESEIAYNQIFENAEELA